MLGIKSGTQTRHVKQEINPTTVAPLVTWFGFNPSMDK